MRVGRLDVPQRAQAEGVDGEHALVAVARDQRDRALGERAEGLAQVHVEAAQLAGQPLISLTIGGSTSSIASTSDRPLRCTNDSTVRFRSWESEPSLVIGTSSMRASWRSRAIVLISPLWPSVEKGCTRLNDGHVLVE